MNKPSLRKLIEEVLGEGKIIACTLSDSELDCECVGRIEPFTAWSEERVCFPVVYDSIEWIDSVPRNPCEEITDHVGR